MKTTRGHASRIVALMTTFLLLMIGAAPTQAAAPGWVNKAGILTGHDTFTGVMQGPDGALYFCAVDGAAEALTVSTVSSGSMNAPVEVSSLPVSSFVPDNMTPRTGTVTDATTLAQMAYIASTASGVDTNRAAAGQIALTRLAGMYAGSIYDWAERGQFQSNNAEALLVPIAMSNDLVAEAKRNAGPYTAALSLSVDGKTGVVSGIGVKSAAGNLVSGFPFTLTLEGPAVWAENGSATLKGTTSGDLRSAKIRITGSGNVRASIKVDGLPTSKVLISTGTSNLGRAQNLMVTGQRQSLVAQSQTRPAVFDFSPVVTSQVVSKELTVGDPLIDELYAKAADGQEWVNINGKPVPVVVQVDVFGPSSVPFPESMSNENQGNLVGTETVVFDGPGTARTTGKFTADEPGFYYYRARVRTDAQDPAFAPYIREFTSPFWEASETSVAKWTPVITSKARTEARDGSTLRILDEITQTGFPEDHGTFEGVTGWSGDAQVVTHELYYFDSRTELAEGATVGMTPVGTVTTPAKNGTFTLDDPSFAVDWTKQAGTYVVVSSYAGDSRTTAVRTSELDENEQVEHNPGTVSTNIRFENPDRSLTDQPVAGADLWDEVTLEGNLPTGSYTEVELYTYANAEAPKCEDPIWTSERIEHNGVAGTYETNRYTSSRDFAGTYTFVEVTYLSDGTVFSRGECGDPDETLTTTFDGKVKTQIGYENAPGVESDQPVAGADIWDNVIVDGTLPTASYTIVELYAYDEVGGPKCEDPIWTSEPIEHDGVAGVYSTNRFTTSRANFGPENPGTYTFVEVTYDKDGNELSRGECGDPDETLTTTFDGKVKTQIGYENAPGVESDQPVAGADIWDNVTVEGTLPEGSYTVVELYSYTDGEAPKCEDPIWTSERIEHNGVAGTYETNRYTTDPNFEGTYTFVEVTYDANGAGLSRGECGDPDETLGVSILEDASNGGAGLAWTGARIGGLTLAGMALIGLGGMAVLRSRKEA